MGGGEGVVHVDVAERGDALRQAFVVLLLADVHPAVLEEHDLTGSGRDFPPIHPVGHDWHRAAEQLPETIRDGLEGVCGFEDAFLRPAQMRRHHHPRALRKRIANGAERGPDARVVGDGAAVVLRHVEVRTDQDPAVSQVQVGHPKDCHGPTPVTSRS